MRCWAHNPGVNIPAAYMWVAAPSGNRIALCVECCAAWRANAAKEPDLQAERIYSL